MSVSFSTNFLFQKITPGFCFAFIFLVVFGKSSMASTSFNVDSTNCSIDSAVVINPLCNNVCSGSISVFAQGSGTLFYQWPGIIGADSAVVSGLCAGTYAVIITDSTGCSAIDSFQVVEPLPIDFNLVVTNSSCPGGCTGTVTVIPLDTLAYSYQWPGYITTAPTLENICEGTYAVIVTDPNGCTSLGSAYVDYDAPFELNVTSTPATCLSSCDGTATVVANGIPPFTYQWESGPIQTTQSAFSLCQGTYKINVTDSTGCVVTDSATIQILPPLAISDTSTMPTCFGGCDGSAEIFIDSTGNYLFEWQISPIQDSAFAVGLCSGWYEVLVTDVSSGCVFSDSVKVIDPPPPLITFSVTPSGCENFCTGTASVQSSGIPPFTYLWQSGSITASDSALCPGVYSVTVSDSLGCSTSSSVTIESVELLHTSMNTTCNTICDGTAEVWLPSGNWQVSWNTIPVQNTTVATGLCNQMYTVTVEDSTGCLISEEIDVFSDQPINSNVTVYPVTCNGTCDGAASLSVLGNQPFLYEWNTIPAQFIDSVSLLCQENYIVTITDSLGCTRVDTVNISGPPSIQFSYNSNTNSCANICDGSAVVFPSLPGSYIYQWQTNPIQYGSSVSNLCSGYTNLEITLGNGCTYLDSVLVIGPNPVFLSMSSLDVSCPGLCDGFAECLALGGSPGYFYEWSNGFTTPQALNLCAGTYTVTVTDQSGCSNQNSVTILEPDSIDIVFNVVDASCELCADGEISTTVSGGTPGYFYFWTPGNATDSTITNLLPGWYTLCVSDANSCSYCLDVEVSFFNSVPSINSNSSRTIVFPNPFSKQATLKVSDNTKLKVENTTIEFYDLAGRKINSISINKGDKINNEWHFKINNSSTSPGIYFYKIMSEDKFIDGGKFVITSN